MTLIWRKDEFIVDRSITDAPFIDNTLAKASYFYYNSPMSRATYVNSRWFIKQQTTPVPPVDHLLLAMIEFLTILVRMITIFFGVTAKRMIWQMI